MKYTQEVLRQMTKEVLVARTVKDPRYEELVSRLSERLCIPTVDVRCELALLTINLGAMEFRFY